VKRQAWLLATAGIASLGLGLVAWHAARPPVSAVSALGAVSTMDAATSPPATATADAPARILFSASFPDPDGKSVDLSRFKGRVLVVNFWATWCAPCVEEMPELQQIAREYSGRGVTVIGVGIDNPAAIRRFRDELGIDFVLLAAGAGGSELARQLGNPSGALPFTLLLDAEGQPSLRRLGRFKAEELRAWLDLHSSKSKT